MAAIADDYAAAARGYWRRLGAVHKVCHAFLMNFDPSPCHKLSQILDPPP